MNKLAEAIEYYLVIERNEALILMCYNMDDDRKQHAE